jgi:hypothetical protein
MAPHPLVQNRSVPRNPTSDGRMIHAQTTFRHHFFQIAIAQRIPEIPAHTQHDQLILEMSSPEYRWPVLSHFAYLSNPAPLFATLPFILAVRLKDHADYYHHNDDDRQHPGSIDKSLELYVSAMGKILSSTPFALVYMVDKCFVLSGFAGG